MLARANPASPAITGFRVMPDPDSPDHAVFYLTWPRLRRHVTLAAAALVVAVGVAVNVIVHDETLFATTVATVVPLLFLLGRIVGAVLDRLLPGLVKINILDRDHDHLNRPGGGWVTGYRDLFALWALARARKKAGYD